MKAKAIKIKTQEGYPIVTHVFEPSVSNAKILLINTATGVKQQVYFAFAHFMQEHGYTVLTYDYRGIGDSKPKEMKGFHSNLKLWGTQDYAALTQYLTQNYQHYQKFCLGHSVGALILGMNPDSQIFKKFVFVATQKSYLGHLRLKTKIEGYLGFGLVLPITTKIFGYFPAQHFGLGESLPKGNAQDWRTLLLHPKSTNKVLENTKDFSKNLTQETLMLWANDDPWLTKTGVYKLFEETYPNLKPEFRRLKAEDSPEKEIGHINFFRKYNRPLWHQVLDFFE